MDGISSKLAIFLLVMLVFSIGSSVDEPIFPRYTETFTTEPFFIGLLVSLGYFVYALFSEPAGQLCDRVGNRKVLLLGAALHPIGSMIFFSASGSIALYVIAGIIVGLGDAFFWAAARTVVAELSKRKHLGRAFGGYDAAWSTGWSLGPLIGGFAAFTSGLLTIPFLVAAVLTAGAAFLMSFETKGLRKKGRLTLKAVHEEMASSRSITEAIGFFRKAGHNVKWLFTLLFILNMFWGLLWAFTPLLFTAYNNLEIGALLFGNSLAFALGVLPAGELADRYGSRRLLTLGLFLAAVLTWFYVQTQVFVESMVIMLLIGMSMSVMLPSVDSIVYKVVGKKHHGALSGFILTSAGFGYVAGPIAGGAIASFSTYSFALLFGAAILAISSLYSLHALRAR